MWLVSCGAPPARTRRRPNRPAVAGATLTVRPPVDPAVSGNRSLDEFAEAGSGTDEQAGGSEATPDASPDAGAPPAADETSDAPASVGSAAEAGGPAPDAEAGTAEAPDVVHDDATTDDDAAAEDDASPDDVAIDPPASTYVWYPEGAPCEACGTAVEERWRDGDDLVCAGCKEW